MSDTIYMIHGMWCGQWCWENYKNLIQKKGYNCVTPTLRFHDMDPHDVPDPRLGTTGLLDYAEDLEQEIRLLSDKPVLMGHSMGGLLAQILASRGLARALVLLAPASPAGIIALRPSVIKSFWSMQTTWGFWKKTMRPTFDEAAYAVFNLMSYDDQKKAYKKLVYESGRAAFEIGYWFLDSKRASRVDETKVSCPVLVIGGGRDRVTPVSVVRHVAEKYEPLSTYTEFENHAHWVIGEPGWEEIVEYITAWLEKILSKQA